MKTKFVLSFLLLSLFLAACGSGATAAPTASSTPTYDPCSEQNLPAEVTRVDGLMREFDDLSLVAQNTPQDQLSQVIPQLQKVLRDAEDQAVPECLVTLKKAQINHMSAVIQTLLILLATPQLDQPALDAINAGTAQARDYHNQYDAELVRLLGATVVAPTATP